MIYSLDELREIYPPVKGRAARKQLAKLDVHMRNYIGKSPFVVIASQGPNGIGDATPRGGEPGFVSIETDQLLLIPDWPGNNRLDSMENIVQNSGVGLLFMIPGVNETLRVNGTASISVDVEKLDRFVTNGCKPRSVMCINIIETYLHCAKALMRSNLWDENTKIDRLGLPTMGQMLKDQIGSSGQPESQSEMEQRYNQELY